MTDVSKIKCPVCRKEHSNTRIELCNECYSKLPEENKNMIMSDLDRVSKTWLK